MPDTATAETSRRKKSPGRNRSYRRGNTSVRLEPLHGGRPRRRQPRSRPGPPATAHRSVRGGTPRGHRARVIASRLWVGGVLRGVVAPARTICERETDCTIRNAANPRAGCRAQQTCEPTRGESRRGGEKPRGRNGIPELVAPGPKVAPVTGSGRAAVMSVEGRRAGRGRETVRGRPTPREEAGYTRPGRQEGSEGELEPGGSTGALPRGTLAGDFRCSKR